jgi:hypothetical protein
LERPASLSNNANLIRCLATCIAEANPNKVLEALLKGGGRCEVMVQTLNPDQRNILCLEALFRAGLVRCEHRVQDPLGTSAELSTVRAFPDVHTSRKVFE